MKKNRSYPMFDYEYHKSESLEVKIFVKVLTFIGIIFSIALFVLVSFLLSSNFHL